MDGAKKKQKTSQKSNTRNRRTARNVIVFITIVKKKITAINTYFILYAKKKTHTGKFNYRFNRISILITMQSAYAGVNYIYFLLRYYYKPLSFIHYLYNVVFVLAVIWF